MKIIAFIFARSGSKGLPNKNIKILNGKPLIAWSIEHAKKINRIDRVIVSTDSEEIARIAREFGAEVPFIRPLELATDESPEWLSWQHGLKYLKSIDGCLPDLMLSIPATAPLRDVDDINNVIDEYQENATDMVITVTEPFRSPFFNIVKEVPHGFVELFMSSDKVINRRQDCPKTFDITTVAYAARPSYVLKRNHMFEGRVRQVIVAKETSLDIDTLQDFEFAEFMFQKKGLED